MLPKVCLWNFSEDLKTAEIGYDLNPTFQRQSIMSKVLKSVVKIGFPEFNIETIKAFTDIQNKSSIKLLKRNQFKFIENKKNDACYLIKKIDL